MATTASSQFGLVFLCMMSIGLLLLMAPQFGTAVECYQYSKQPKSSGNVPTRGSAARQLSELARMTGLSGFGMPSTTTNGNGTQTCSSEHEYCLTLHCEPMLGYGTQKGCEIIPADVLCDWGRILCQEDPKFYCRTCHTDKCNNEPVEDDSDAIGMQHN